MIVPCIGHLNNCLLQKLDSLLPSVEYIRQTGSSSVPLQWSQGQEDLGGGEPARASWDLLGMASAGPTPSTGRDFRGASLCSLAFDGPALGCWSSILLATASSPDLSTTTWDLVRRPFLGSGLGLSLFSGEFSGESSMMINSCSDSSSGVGGAHLGPPGLSGVDALASLSLLVEAACLPVSTLSRVPRSLVSSPARGVLHLTALALEALTPSGLRGVLGLSSLGAAPSSTRQTSSFGKAALRQARYRYPSLGS